MLLIRGWTSGKNWELPGGGVGKHETPSEAIRREVHEELGINIVQRDLVDIGTVYQGYKATIFRLNIPREIILKRHKWEIAEICWFKEVDGSLKVTKITELALEKLSKKA